MNRSEQPYDLVEKPKHYNVHPSGVECIELAELLRFAPGNVLKYVWRSGVKDAAFEIQDYRKAEWYLKRSIQNADYVNSNNARYEAERIANKVVAQHSAEAIASMIKHLVKAEYAVPSERELLLKLALSELQHYILVREQEKA